MVVYTVEGVAPYASELEPFWGAAARGDVTVATSELTLLETLVVPLRDGNRELEDTYAEFLMHGDIRLLPIDRAVLRQAARLRAETSLRTPDAIHASTCQLAGCAAFLTNDHRLRSVPGLPTIVLAATR